LFIDAEEETRASVEVMRAAAVEEGESLDVTGASVDVARASLDVARASLEVPSEAGELKIASQGVRIEPVRATT
jgi:hypothetical protein